MLINLIMLLVIFIPIVSVVLTISYRNENNKLTKEQYEILDEIVKVEEEKQKYL